jgi:hypothetical protein
MNIRFNLRKLGKFYSQYKSAADMVSYLKGCIPLFMRQSISGGSSDKRLLIASIGYYDAKTEAIYAKAFESFGYDIYVITRWDPFVAKIFEIFGIKKICFYHNYTKNISLARIKAKAKYIVCNINARNILKLTENGTRVGKYAASSFMRITRGSNFDLENIQIRPLFIKELIRSLKAVTMAENILQDIKPVLLLVNDRGYTPVGQLFDICLNRGVPVIQRCGSHKSGSEILKRYSSPEMADIHHHSLSKQSWEYIKNMPWNIGLYQRLHSELESTYRSGDWFSEVGTQFNKIIYPKDKLISKLGIDSNKRTAVIFPHIFWDATFFWGEGLFEDYYDWFINVLKIAQKKSNFNWIVKIHPANIVKAKRDNYYGSHKELTAIYETLGEIPQHIKVIPPESDINTFSLFPIMDYCLTVRGTVGIEAAAFAIRTLTAGTGRYDHLGFTYDFDSAKEYINSLENLENIPPMSEEEIILARRYAYGLFILRPIYLDILEHGYRQDKKATMKFNPLFKTRREFEQSNFVKKLRDFILSDEEDFINRDILQTD